jgi:hypothetical protein
MGPEDLGTAILVGALGKILAGATVGALFGALFLQGRWALGAVIGIVANFARHALLVLQR